MEGVVQHCVKNKYGIHQHPCLQEMAHWIMYLVPQSRGISFASDKKKLRNTARESWNAMSARTPLDVFWDILKVNRTKNHRHRVPLEQKYTTTKQNHRAVFVVLTQFLVLFVKNQRLKCRHYVPSRRHEQGRYTWQKSQTRH